MPFEGAVILKNGEPYCGAYYAAGVYLADAETCRRAQKHLLEIDHRQALRENDWRDKNVLTFDITDYGLAAIDRGNAA
jgi:hypothetical protein